MREHQRQGLTEGVAALFDEGAATYWELEHQRILYGATRAELVEILDNLDHVIAREYEDAYGVVA